jgi:hypothetical protein
MGLEPSPTREAMVLYLFREGGKVGVSHAQRLPKRRFPMQYIRRDGEDGVPLSFYYRILGPGGEELYIGTGRDPTGQTIEHPTLERTASGIATPGLARMKSTREVSHFFLTIPYFEDASAVEMYGVDPDAEERGATLLARIERAQWQ